MNIISWNTTRECNMKCKHCYREAGQIDQNELTTAEGMKLLEEIARAGFKIMVFSGGEPLLRQDIFDLARRAGELGMRPVFGTNGTVITPEIARKLKNCGVQRLGISVHSPDPQFHDFFHGVEGSWQMAVDGVRYAHEAGLEVQLHSTVTEWNYDRVEEITDLAVKLGCQAHHVFFLVPTGRGKDLESEMLNAVHYEKLLHRILDKQKTVNIELKPTCAPQFMRIARLKNIPMRFTRGCLAGTNYCVITPNGDVNPCPYLSLKVGNVREQPFDEIWATNPVFQQLRTMEFGGRCGTCDHKDVCGGCRARAFYATGGDVMAEDPWCLYRKGASNGAAAAPGGCASRGEACG